MLKFLMCAASMCRVAVPGEHEACRANRPSQTGSAQNEVLRSASRVAPWVTRYSSLSILGEHNGFGREGKGNWGGEIAEGAVLTGDEKDFDKVLDKVSDEVSDKVSDEVLDKVMRKGEQGNLQIRSRGYCGGV